MPTEQRSATQPVRALRTVLLGTAITLIIPFALASAQGTAITNNVYCNKADPGVATIQVVRNGSLSRECSFNGTALTEASAIGGLLRVNASFDPANNSTGLPSNGDGISATASWVDEIIVNDAPIAPSFARVTVALNGRLEADGVNTVGADFDFSAPGFNDRQSYSLSTASTRDVNDMFSYVIPLFFASGGYYQTAFYLGLTVGVSGGGQITDTGARGLFGNTAGVTGVEILDAQQQVIDGASFSFANDLQLYSVRSVPEPAGVALLFIGLVAMGAVARRRRAI